LEYLQTLGKLFGCLVYFVFIWYIFAVLVSCTKEKSGKPDFSSRSMRGSVFGLFVHLVNPQVAVLIYDGTVPGEQGEQVERILALCAIVYIGHLKK
jgi:hypothetical protein